jgi:tRNA(His) 5'-end guanylyltransferase
MKKDDLSTRMKGYEAVTKYKLPRKGYTMIRIDGKAFHTYTKGLVRPFDKGFVEDMDRTAKYLCKEIQNAVCAFVQSDEISILLCDFEKNETNAWFDNSVQKMCSVSSSMATTGFNRARIARIVEEGYTIITRIQDMKWGEFDSRVYQLPAKYEVANYMIWRQQDTVKNSISSVAQSMFSHKELNGKNGNDKQEMMFQKDGTNWNDFDPKLKRGRMITKETYEKEPDVIRTRWVSNAPPTFTQDKDYLDMLVPDREMSRLLY